MRTTSIEEWDEGYSDGEAEEELLPSLEGRSERWLLRERLRRRRRRLGEEPSRGCCSASLWERLSAEDDDDERGRDESERGRLSRLDRLLLPERCPEERLDEELERLDWERLDERRSLLELWPDERRPEDARAGVAGEKRDLKKRLKRPNNPPSVSGFPAKAAGRGTLAVADHVATDGVEGSLREPEERSLWLRGRLLRP
jgi:hypothetical protein